MPLRSSTTHPALAVALSGALLLACDGTPAPTTPEDPDPPPMPPVLREAPTLHELTTTTMVVERGVGTVQLLAEPVGPSADALVSVEIRVRSSLDAFQPNPDRPLRWWFEHDGERIERATLRDDGTGGDAVAGDGVFSSVPFHPVTADPRTLGSRYSLGIDTLVWTFPDTVLATALEGDDRIWLHVFDVESGLLPPVEVVDLAPGIRRAGHVVSMAFERPEAVTLPQPPSQPRVLEAWYAHVGWEPDFLAIYEMFARSLHGPGAFFSIVNSDTEGIGREIFARSEELGVPTSLQGMLVMRGPPSPEGQYILPHEILHRWAVFLDPELGLTDNAHWGGLDRERTFGPVYNDLELYLMGLLPADSVIPARVGKNGVTIGDIVERHGPRVPAWPDAPTTFTMGTVLVHHRLLDETELRLADYLLREFAEGSHPARDWTVPSFGAATGGRGRMVTRIPDAPAPGGRR